MAGKCREWCTKGSCRFTDRGGSCSFKPHLPQDKGAAKGPTTPAKKKRQEMPGRMESANLSSAGSYDDSIDGTADREACLRSMAREGKARRSGQRGGGGREQRNPGRR